MNVDKFSSYLKYVMNTYKREIHFKMKQVHRTHSVQGKWVKRMYCKGNNVLKHLIYTRYCGKYKFQLNNLNHLIIFPIIQQCATVIHLNSVVILFTCFCCFS